MALNPEFDDEPRLTRRRESVQFRNKLELAGSGSALQNKIVGVAGRKGSGKSTVTREILQRCTREFLFDTMGEHSWVPDEFYDLAEAHSYIFEHGADWSPFIGSYIPEDAGKDSLESSFSEISMAVYEAGNMTLVVEELPMLSQPNYVPPAFDRVIRLGRHRCINILYTGQRLSECPRRVTAATDVFILFSHTEPRDLDAIAERTQPEVADLVRRLGDHEFVVYDVASRKVLVIDSEWYDSVLTTEKQWTPAVGGRNGRSSLWSLNDGD
jgi:hypothetical protein